MNNFRNLKVWEKAHAMNYRLISQIRRSAASVPANIAEGCGRRGSDQRVT